MKYSGFIDSILAEAAFAKKTNDASWLIGRLQAETDPIKRKLLSVVCNADFIKGMKREAGWLREQKGKLEDIAADIEDGIEEIEAEEVNDHMQSVNYQLAKAAYDDDEDEEEDSMPLKSDSDEDEDDFYSSITNGWAGASSQAADPSDPDMGIQDDPPSFKELPWDLPKIPDWYTPSDRRPEINLDSTTQDRKGEDSDKKWEQMRKEAAKKYGVKKEDPVKKFENVLKQQRKNPLLSSNGDGPTAEETREIETKLLSSIPKSLKRLARMIGRTGGIGTTTGKTFGRASKSDISGITVGDDLNSLLPTEIAMLSEKGTQDIFYRNYAEKRLQVFASASSGEAKKEHQDGPVIICLDTSSSMNGEPATIAKMLTIAVAIYAMRRRRKVMVIKYSFNYECETFKSMKRDKDKLMEFLSWHGVGGNDENRMFSYLFGKRLPKEPAYDTADILCISDFGWCYLCEEVQEMIAKAKEGGMKFYGLAVNLYNPRSMGIMEAMNICDSKWQWEGGECVEITEGEIDREKILK
jgi:uncharacterized protein with von Willebrand factor type A (vWA) domain